MQGYLYASDTVPCFYNYEKRETNGIQLIVCACCKTGLPPYVGPAPDVNEAHYSFMCLIPY